MTDISYVSARRDKLYPVLSYRSNICSNVYWKRNE